MQIYKSTPPQTINHLINHSILMQESMIIDTERELLLAAIFEHAELWAGPVTQAYEYGADAGWDGFTVPHEAAVFFDRNSKRVMRLACRCVHEQGFKNVRALLSTFDRGDLLGTAEGFKVLLAWFALEEAGRYLYHRQSGWMYS